MHDVPELPVYGFEPDLGGLLSLVITILLPIVVGLVTRQSTSAGVKATLLLFLAAVTTVLKAWLQATQMDVPFEAVPLIYTTLINFGIAVAVHFGFYKPTGVAGAAQGTLNTDKSPERV
ncbi:hypothetical protein AB0B94_30750 [Micromonospora sp. NPDC048986]|uniref:hypothetical protein n=1 Tax=Micromonospora sp. NPDC048986 TaxID=3155644 RepID=UPI0033E363B9